MRTETHNTKGEAMKTAPMTADRQLERLLAASRHVCATASHPTGNDTVAWIVAGELGAALTELHAMLQAIEAGEVTAEGLADAKAEKDGAR